MDVAAPAGSSTTASSRIAGWVQWLRHPDAGVVIGSLGIAGLAWILRELMGPFQGRPLIFEYLFMRNEPSAAVLSAVVVGAAVIARNKIGALEQLVTRLSQRPHAFVAATTFLCACGAVIVYRRHPLSMDEYAPVFQAAAFARGGLAGKVPPELLPRLIPPVHWFLLASPSGEMISVYWPGFALLLTPFTLLGCPWLLNPLITGASLLVLWHVAGIIFPGTTAPGWTVLIAAASPAFFVNGMSFYSMPAHLLCSTAFVALLLNPAGPRLFWAGVVGSFALSLHNPFPHVLFALPWILWIALQPGRLRRLFTLAAGYLPGTAILCGGWLVLRSRLTAASDPGRVASGLLEELRRSAFTLPGPEVLWNRSLALVELGLWAVPLLLPLAVLGARRLRGRIEARLLVRSALLTLAGFFFVRYDQGHGWGFRYFHSAWGVLPLLAAGALEMAPSAQVSLRRLAIAASLGSLLLANPLRCLQVRSMIDAHLAQIPREAAERSREVVFVRPDRGYYSIDLVQNDPFLEGRRWTLIGHGATDEEQFMRRAFPAAHRVAANPVASVWEVP